MNERKTVIVGEPLRLTIRPRGQVAPPRVPIEPPRKRAKKSRGLLKGGAVVLGAILLTTVAIKANDSFKLEDTFLFAAAGKSSSNASCPPDMAFITTSTGGFCIDRYEASAGELCPIKDPTSSIQTNENSAVQLCAPASLRGRNPWVNVTLNQAMALCARAGKRLPSSGEWFRAGLGTPEIVGASKDICVLGRKNLSRAELAGVREECVSSYGVYDMVGNVWEWVDANIVDGMLDDQLLPTEGYVTEADINGIPVSTGTTSSAIFGDDYFFNDPRGVRGLFRGGFWNMDERAGIYSANATIEPSFAGAAVGFRCAK